MVKNADFNKYDQRQGDGFRQAGTRVVSGSQPDYAELQVPSAKDSDVRISLLDHARLAVCTTVLSLKLLLLSHPQNRSETKSVFGDKGFCNDGMGFRSTRRTFAFYRS